MHAGLLFVKAPDRAKTRLRAALGAKEMADLTRALIADALDLLETADFLRWWVVSDDDAVLEDSGRRGFDAVRDSGAGLNEAATAAIGAVMRAGATSATLLACDVPLATAEDLRDVLDTGETSDVVVVPGARGGTNALHLSPPDAIPPGFGEGSLGLHLQRAQEAGLRAVILALPRLELDLDLPEDLDEFLTRGPSGHVAAVLRGSAAR
jgi:2-phospho-L-lactate/phosphoenolpyruvate guanylyltransferase